MEVISHLNYIAEIRAFYDWTTFNPVPADAQALWHTLMHLNNKCAVKIDGQWLWRVEFTIANGTLESILKFSRTQLDRMRNALVQAGRIEYRKGRGNQSGTYRLIPFDTQYVAQTVTQADTQSVTQPVTQVWRKLCTISNYNNTPTFNPNLYYDDGDDARGGAQESGGNFEGEGPSEVTPDTLFQKYFGKNPTEAERGICRIFLDKFDNDVLETAFFRACELDNKNFGYVKGIMENYQKRGVKDMGDVADDDMRHAEAKGRLSHA